MGVHILLSVCGQAGWVAREEIRGAPLVLGIAVKELVSAPS